MALVCFYGNGATHSHARSIAQALLKHAHSFDCCVQVQHQKSAIHGLPVTLRMPRVKSEKSVLVSIYCVYKAIRDWNVVGSGQGSDFQRMTKWTPGDEVAMWYACTSDACALETRRRSVTQRGKKKKAETLTQASAALVIILASHHCDLCDFTGTHDFG